MLFPYFVYIAHFTNFTCESFFLKEKSLLVENHERKKVVGEKNKKNKTGLKKKERVPICQEKKKTSFVKATGTKKSPPNQNLPYIMLKRGFLLFMQVLALIQKD